jgi:hypothetical protein
VNNSNIISRIIDIADIDVNTDIYEYVKRLDNRVDYINTHFKISSNKYKGSLLENELVDDSNEIFMYVTNDIDIFNMQDVWDDLSPLTVLKHSNTDLSFNKLEDVYSSDELFIYGIDTKMLLLQYKYWAIDRLSKNMSIDSSYYVYQYVYPGALESYFNISIMNRYFNIYSDIPNYNTESDYPFLVKDLYNTVDKILEYSVKRNTDVSKDYVHMLKEIPNLFKDESMHESMLLPNQYFNNNNIWIFMLSKLEYMYLLLSMSSKRGLKRNKGYILDLKLMIKDVKRNRYIQYEYSKIYELEIDLTLSNINNLIGE